LDDEGISAYADGDDLNVVIRRPETIAGDPRPHARYFIKPINLSRPRQPTIAQDINIPGTPIAVDRTTVFTRDRVWGDHTVETALSRVRMRRGQARLQGHQRFPDRQVDSVAVDPKGIAAVSHSLAWRPAYSYGWDPNQKLTALDRDNRP